MNKIVRSIAVVGMVAAVALVLDSDPAYGQRGGRGGGGARGGGGVSRPAGGGVSRPAGGGVARPPSGGISRPPSGGVQRPNLPSNLPSNLPNRSPGISSPRPSNPIAGGATNRPGNITPPGGFTPGSRPPVNVGKGPIGGGNVGGGVGKGPSGGNRPVDPGFGRPGAGAGVLPGLGVAAGAGAIRNRAGDNLGRRQGNIADRKTNITDRSQNLQDRMESRQDFWQQSQDQRQEYLNNRREDWQNWHDDHYPYHDHWYHGSWCDHGEGWWDHMWSEHTAAMVLGTTFWGVNRLGYWFGTGSYTNPYYETPVVVENTTLDYSAPLPEPPVEVVVAPGVAPPALPPGVTEAGLKNFEDAQTAFYQEDYKKALELTNKALASMPTNAVITEFRALVLFALGQYKESAATLYPVLAITPGMDWTTLSGLYPNNEVYTKQLRNLEIWVRDHPRAPEGHFLAGYHYLTLNSVEHAIAEFKKVQELLPQDRVMGQLLETLGSKADPTTQPPAPVKGGEVKIDVVSLVGTWTASGASKASFTLTLGSDKEFTWVYQQGKTQQQVKGAYALDGNSLALEPDQGGVMLAEITPPVDGNFSFTPLGDPKSNPPLRFQKK